jgi:hypothetical protein
MLFLYARLCLLCWKHVLCMLFRMIIRCGPWTLQDVHRCIGINPLPMMGALGGTMPAIVSNLADWPLWFLQLIDYWSVRISQNLLRAP